MTIHRNSVTGKFNQESVYFNKFEFSRQNIFRHLTRTHGLRGFLQIICLNLRQLKTHREKNWREFWIAWNIGTVTYQKNPFLKMIYLYSDRDYQNPSYTIDDHQRNDQITDNYNSDIGHGEDSDHFKDSKSSKFHLISFRFRIWMYVSRLYCKLRKYVCLKIRYVCEHRYVSEQMDGIAHTAWNS